MIVNFSITAPDFHIYRLEWRKFKSEDEGVLVLNGWGVSSDIINIKYLNVRKIRKHKVMQKYIHIYIHGKEQTHSLSFGVQPNMSNVPRVR